MNNVLSLIQKLGAIGDQPGDDTRVRTWHQLVVYLGCLMSVGGLTWGTLALVADKPLPATIPFGYTVITALNLLYFWRSKNFTVVRFIQVLISLLLPFAFQWVLGGFHASGAVMIWGMISVFASITFSEARWPAIWLSAFLALTVVSGVVDPAVQTLFGSDDDSLSSLFFTINFLMVTGTVFGMGLFFAQQREKDHTELKAANARIRHLNASVEAEAARFRAIVENMADGLLAIGLEGELQASNPALGRVLGLGAIRDGQTVLDQVPAEITELLRAAMASNAPVKAEFSLPGDRAVAAAASSITTGKGGGEQRIGSVMIVRDISSEKEVDRMKTEFTATVSHELRTPLTSVLGFAKLTRNRLEARVFDHVPKDDAKSLKAVEQVRANLDVIVSEGNRLTSLINNVLDISKMESGHMEWRRERVVPATLLANAQAATSSLFTSDAVRLELTIEDDLPTLEGDGDRLLQVVINLISNAQKFTAQGSVTVAARLVSDGVEFSVTDTGEGIDAADLPYVFEKFRQVGDTMTNRPQGTGLGLPICQQIVAAHAGTMQASSEVGRGSRFSFTLPLQAEPSRDVKLGELRRLLQIHRDEAPADSERTVLVVDDDTNLREMLRQELSDRGYEVRLARNGAEALSQVRASLPDLIILDVMMPDISGFDVATVLRAQPETARVPIIILSIIAGTDDETFRLGINRYLTKPTDPDVLSDEVRRLIRYARSAHRVLVFGELTDELREVVEKGGCTVIGNCEPGRCIDIALETEPDLILISAPAERGEELLRRVRAHDKLADTYVVHLTEAEADGEV